MRGKAFILAAALVVSLASPVVADPAPTSAPTAPVDLTADEMTAVSNALDLAAAQCGNNPNACAVGTYKPQIVNKLVDAYKKLPKATAPTKH